MELFKKIYVALVIGFGLYTMGYIFGEWLATGQIDLSTLNILLPMILVLPALLFSKKEKK